nr:hypothetical protein [uncultured Niameybacter sp.]
MKKNIRLLYCILGSIIFSLTNELAYDSFHSIPFIGFMLSQSTYYISTIGCLSTIYFSIKLIKENYREKC